MHVELDYSGDLIRVAPLRDMQWPVSGLRAAGLCGIGTAEYAADHDRQSKDPIMWPLAASHERLSSSPAQRAMRQTADACRAEDSFTRSRYDTRYRLVVLIEPRGFVTTTTL